MKDEGFATVVVLALCGVLAASGGLVAVLGEVAVARHRAAAAADLAALAGAADALAGTACTTAASVARRNGATLLSCVLEGLDVEVTVSVEALSWGVTEAPPPPGPGTSGGARASYRGRG